VVVDVKVRGDRWHKAQLKHKETDVEKSIRWTQTKKDVKTERMLLSPST